MKSRFLLLALCLSLQMNGQIQDFDTIDFSKADRIALSYQGENLKNLPDLVYKLTSPLDTDVEKFRSLYKWVCHNVANDYKLYLKNKKKREKFEDDSLKLEAWNDSFKTKLFKKLRKRKKTICSGYSYILSELAKLANIRCVMVNGFGRTSTTSLDNFNSTNHSWNAVLLNGKWYLCDATWASGIISPETNGFKFGFIEGLFLTNPELFALTHFPIESRWMLLPQENTPSFETFLGNPVLYSTAYRHLDAIISPKNMSHLISKNDVLSFHYRLTNPIGSNSVSLTLDDGFNMNSFKPNNIDLTGNNLTFVHKFNRRGFFDVHLAIGSDYIATYTVKVE